MLLSFLTVALLLFSTPAPVHRTVDVFDTGPMQVLPADSLTFDLPTPPPGAIGFKVSTQIAYDFSVACENRNAGPLSYVELGGNFVATIGGSYFVQCYGTTIDNLSAWRFPYWSGPDTGQQDFASGPLTNGEPQFTTMTQTYAQPIEWYDPHVTLFQNTHGVEGWMTPDLVWHPSDYTVPYFYTPTRVRLRGVVIWDYGN